MVRAVGASQDTRDGLRFPGAIIVKCFSSKTTTPDGSIVAHQEESCEKNKEVPSNENEKNQERTGWRSFVFKLIQENPWGI